jgi:hypothetical protein
MIMLAFVSPPSKLPWKDEFLVIVVGFTLRFMLVVAPKVVLL